MNTLQDLLVILDGQKLTAGYLTPGGPTALETAIALMNGFNTWVLYQNPITPPATLLTPAYVSNKAGQPTGIYLSDVSGNLDLSFGQPAYVFAS